VAKRKATKAAPRKRASRELPSRITVLPLHDLLAAIREATGPRISGPTGSEVASAILTAGERSTGLSEARNMTAPTSPITNALNVLEQFGVIEHRIYSLMSSLIGPQPESGSDAAGSPTPSGALLSLDNAADVAQQRIQRLHAMLNLIERALP
jgi:hypothetical protein